MNRRFAQVDVFASGPLSGNPVAVVIDADGLTAHQMQAMARWTNLSETTFIAPPSDPTADYAVRIFTPERELPFAGHPTLGTCHAWLASGGVPQGDRIVQECGLGLIPVQRSGDGVLAFAAPAPLRSGPLEDPREIAAQLGLPPAAVVDHQWCDNGPPWQALLLQSAEQVLKAAPGPSLSGRFIGLIGPQPAGAGTDFEVRAFFPNGQGTAEDPVTGSLNAALAQWLIGSGQAPDRYTAAQGTAMGRAGRLQIDRQGDDIWVGGRCTTVLEGTAALQ